MNVTSSAAPAASFCSANALKAAPPPPIEEGEDLDTPIDPEDLEFEDIELDEPAGGGAAASVEPAEVEEPEDEAPADDDDD